MPPRAHAVAAVASPNPRRRGPPCEGKDPAEDAHLLLTPFPAHLLPILARSLLRAPAVAAVLDELAADVWGRPV